MTYAEKLRDPRWQKMRLEILQRDRFSCVLCADTETELHVHHQEYKGQPWQADPRKLFTLCKHCHTEVEFYPKGTPIASLSITKIRRWTSGTRIMIINNGIKCALIIYNGKDERLVGLELGGKSIAEMAFAFNFAALSIEEFKEISL